MTLDLIATVVFDPRLARKIRKRPKMGTEIWEIL
jgi:hypothetical protein